MADWRGLRVVLEEVERDVGGCVRAQRPSRCLAQLRASNVHLYDVLVLRQVLAAVL